LSDLKRTPLYEHHKALGGKLVPFAGWEMPVEYGGILREHTAVRTSMGMFDVSHMGEIEIHGKRALEFCQRVSTNDVSRLKAGNVQYSAICNEEGGVLDDCTLYRLAEHHFLFVVNASNREKIFQWFSEHPMEGARVEDRSDDYALIAVQGKKAESLLSRVAKRDLSTILFYEFTWTELVGAAALISRTGYTGEDGFEIYVPAQKAVDLWELLLTEGKADGLVPVGLGARDTLRLEMGYLLYGNDMDEKTTPLAAGIGWAVKLDKGNFFGRERLVRQKQEGLKRKLRGLKMTGRGIPRSHYGIHFHGKKIGEVTSGTFSPSLKLGIALGYLEAGVVDAISVNVMIRDRETPAVVVKPPFVPGSIKR
jgi:aminomethyltransferase